MNISKYLGTEAPKSVLECSQLSKLCPLYNMMT